MIEANFGRIKQARGFRQFLLRGMEKMRGEWRLVCTEHNSSNLFGGQPAVTAWGTGTDIVVLARSAIIRGKAMSPATSTNSGFLQHRAADRPIFRPRSRRCDPLFGQNPKCSQCRSR